MTNNNLLNQIYNNQKVNGQFTANQKDNVQKINEIVNKFIHGEISEVQQVAQQILNILGKGGNFLSKNWESFNLAINCKNGAKLTVRIENGLLKDSFTITNHLNELTDTSVNNTENSQKNVTLASAQHSSAVNILDNIFNNPRLAEKAQVSIDNSQIIIKINKPNTTDNYYQTSLSQDQAEKLLDDYFAKLQTNQLTKEELSLISKIFEAKNMLNIEQNFDFDKTIFIQNLKVFTEAFAQIDRNKTDFKEIQIIFNLIQDFLYNTEQSWQTTSVKEFLNNFQKQYADLISDNAKKIINDFLRGTAQPSNQQFVFNSLINQLFVTQQIPNSQKAHFFKLCLSQALIDSMGYFQKTVIGSDVQCLAKIIDTSTDHYLAQHEIKAQEAINTIINTAIKSNIEDHLTKNNQLSANELVKRANQVALVYQQAIENNDLSQLKNYLGEKELEEFANALKIIPESIKKNLATDIHKISFNITYNYLTGKNNSLDKIVSTTVKEYEKNIKKYSFTTVESLAKNNEEKTALAILDRLYDPKSKFFQWAAVNRAQNTKTTAIITSSIVLTVATVGTAGALAPAQASLLATMASGKTIATAIGGGALLTVSQGAINSIYGEAIWQNENLSNQQKFNKIFADVLINSLSMYGAIAGGTYAKGLDNIAKQGIISTFKAGIKAIGFDLAESTVTTTTQSIIDLTEKIISGQDFDLDDILQNFSSELKMNLLMSVVGNLASLGLENSTKAAKRLYQEAMQLRFKQLTDKITIRANNGKISEQLTKQLGESNARRIFGLTSEAKIRQQEFLAVDYLVGNKLKTITFWGNQYHVDFDASKLPQDAKVTAVFHGGPHATGMSLEDQQFYKLLDKNTTINHIDTSGSGSIIQFTGRSREQNLANSSRLNSSSEVTTLTRNLERARNKEQFEQWLKDVEVLKDKSGQPEIIKAKRDIEYLKGSFDQLYENTENRTKLVKAYLERSSYGSDLKKSIQLDETAEKQYLVEIFQTKIASINGKYRREHINFLARLNKQTNLNLSRDVFNRRVEDLNQALIDEFCNLKNTADMLKANNITISTNRLQSSVNFLDGLIENIDKNLEWLEKNPRIDSLDNGKILKEIKRQTIQIRNIVKDEISLRKIKYTSKKSKVLENK